MEDKFILFSNEHLITVGIGFISCILLVFLGFFTEKKATFAKIVAIAVLGVKIAELLFRHHYYGETVAELLPLHLCPIVIILSIFMMFFHSEVLFQPVYFWSIGEFFAILMPDIRDGMSNFASQSFFITHFFILFSTAYAFVHFRFRPTKVGFLCSFLLLVTLAFIMYFVNNKLGTNFLYVNHPPVTKSLMDFMGPWPYYIFSLAGIDIAISFFMYLPFRKNKKSKYGSWKSY
ncbi:Predicted integral membrane protein [Fusobacterium polymorphum]|uniref:Possible inner membrane protein n=1 Tax=Fusobacterium polymorphum ATCC 10953 TaxID=393480 RepID=A5TUQ3_FUSNP|nr:TIGR02206 family membrane protein [Fusobacterium polymorphum]EDK88628.1 possible inner membrane protein [Fusobacterium polymorphum ATCC 10953]UTI52018.1 TIGR02206 family membrane protein [Fusobacterium polymorphum]WRL68739.1 TIGR02206 family membrane protein [Fusobacterium polymorphum]CKG92694.1 Predicted integral membrane protein [Fusobacterium polymorphum]